MRASALVVMAFLVFAPACDKGSDSSGEESDADTDTDTDADTGFYGELTFTVTTDDGDIMCQTSIALEGTPYTGGPCKLCDFFFALEPTVTSEKGIACNDDDWSPRYNFLPMWSKPYTYLGFASMTSGGADNALFAGYATGAGATVSLGGGPVVSDSSFEGSATYKAGLLEWSIDFDQYVSRHYVDWCSGRPVYAPDFSYTKGYHGKYYVTGALDFDTFAYDVWSFVASDSYTYITMDTADAKTAFDAAFIVMDDTGCPIIEVDDQFECTYPPPAWTCPAYSMPTTKGSTYQVLVHSFEEHYGTKAGDYILAIQSSADPGLTLVKSDIPTIGTWTITAEGTAHIPKAKKP